ncbi:hypothetical protein ACC702_40030, partial [Rhizobium ruizarguesonis]
PRDEFWQFLTSNAVGTDQHYWFLEVHLPCLYYNKDDDDQSSIANRDQSAKQPALVLQPSTRALIGVVCVMAIFFVY